MPLEVLRWPVTPVGMHYLLSTTTSRWSAREWTLTVDGNVGTPLALALDDVRALPAHEVVATMECAGNGRAKFTPRPVSQPGSTRRSVPDAGAASRLRDVLERAAAVTARVEVLFTGLDRGIEGGEEQGYQRSLPRWRHSATRSSSPTS